MQEITKVTENVHTIRNTKIVVKQVPLDSALVKCLPLGGHDDETQRTLSGGTNERKPCKVRTVEMEMGKGATTDEVLPVRARVTSDT